MIDRDFDDGDVIGKATFSPCEKYRYTLSRFWGPNVRYLPVLMLNPSTATERLLDPTIRRVINFAKREGFGGIIVGNIFAFRATKPKDMMAQVDPIGLENDAVIRNLAMHAKVNRHELLCGWGAGGGHLDRNRQIGALLSEVDVNAVCLGKTASGDPRHPLYVAGDQPFEPWSM